MATRRKNYGLVVARIDDQAQRIELSFSPRKPGQLSDQVRESCVRWALNRLRPLQDEGYTIDDLAVQAG